MSNKISRWLKETADTLDVAYIGVYDNTLSYYNSKHEHIDVSGFTVGTDEYMLISIITEYANLYLNGDIAVKNGLFSRSLYLSYFINLSYSAGFPVENRVNQLETVYLLNNYDNIKVMLEHYKTPYALHSEYTDRAIEDLYNFILDWNNTCSIIDVYYPGFEEEYSVPKWITNSKIAEIYYTQNPTNEEFKVIFEEMYSKELAYLKSEDNFIDFEFIDKIGPVISVNDYNEAMVINVYGANIHIKEVTPTSD